MTPGDDKLRFDPDSAAIGDGIFGLPFGPEDSRVVLIPVPWEATVSYGTGAAEGPAAILQASRQVDLFDLETGRPYEHGIAMLPISEEIEQWNQTARTLAGPIIERGGLEAVEDTPNEGTDLAQVRNAVAHVETLAEQLNEWVERTWNEWADRGKLIGILGGDHSVPLGGILAASARHPGLGILHFDAHADLREAYEGFRYSHASIFDNVLVGASGLERLVQVGLRDISNAERARIEDDPRIRTFFDPDLRRRLQDGEPWTQIAREIVETLPGEVYVSFDIDALDPTLCPHTGTPVPGGLSFPEATSILRHVVESGRTIVGFDLCEVAPDPTSDAEWDANVGARVLYKLIGFALASVSRRD